DQTADAPAEPARVRLELAPNLRLTLAAIEDDEVLEQPRLIIVEHLDLDRPPRAAACRQEAMAVGIRSRANVLHERTLRILVPADHERHDAAAVEKNQPADRPREHEIALAVLEVAVPAHLLRERQVAQQPTRDIGEHVDCRLAALTHAIREVDAL